MVLLHVIKLQFKRLAQATYIIEHLLLNTKVHK